MNVTRLTNLWDRSRTVIFQVLHMHIFKKLTYVKLSVLYLVTNYWILQSSINVYVRNDANVSLLHNICYKVKFETSFKIGIVLLKTHYHTPPRIHSTLRESDMPYIMNLNKYFSLITSEKCSIKLHLFIVKIKHNFNGIENVLKLFLKTLSY